MAEITAALVKDLREKTGAGMMDCKRALGEANGDIRYGWMQQVAEGLQALHQAGAILEGVRPDLITVTASGQAVLGDEPAPGKPRNENLGVLIVRNLPGFALEPEPSISRCRKMKTAMVKELRGR